MNSFSANKNYQRPKQISTDEYSTENILNKNFNLNANIRDVRDNIYDDSYQLLYKQPAVMMNDYTKNISSPIFTPGLCLQTKELTKKANNYMTSEYRTQKLQLKPKLMMAKNIQNNFDQFD